jgi:hypothetical protein
MEEADQKERNEICNIIKYQRNKIASNINRLGRVELYNPYIDSKYTKYDFDMRRKSEILKYKSNESTTQTNNLTKKQRWSMISKGTYNSISQAQLNNAMLIGNNVSVLQDCSTSSIIYTPTSSSDVPGPVIYLYNDESVPLYNYK